MRVLGINSIFHDSAAALVIDGEIVAAAEEERFTRRKHGKRPVPFSAWEQPGNAARWCLQKAGLRPDEIDAVAFSYDPGLVADYPAEGSDPYPAWEYLRTQYASRAPYLLSTELPGLDPAKARFIRHHVAHAASCALAGPLPDPAVLVLDGRGEATSMLSGRYVDGKLDIKSAQELPHSLGLAFEELTEHVGFQRSSDEYKVMALASYGQPRFAQQFREKMYATGDGGFRTEPISWSDFATRRAPESKMQSEHADLASSFQLVLEEVLLDLCRWLKDETGAESLTMAGGVALNCVANTRIHAEGPFQNIWVQPASGDSGTALGAALTVAAEEGDRCQPMGTAALGRGFSDTEIRQALESAAVPFDEPADIAEAAAETLAANGVVAWFQGAAEFGPRALGHRSLLAHPGIAPNTERLNVIKGREQFRPVAPMVLADRASEIFSRGPFPSPYMLFVHDVAAEWRSRLPVVTHVDGTARVQTVDPAEDPLTARMLAEFEKRTGFPVVVNTSLNTAGRPIVDTPRDALECFGSSPIDLLAIGPYAVRRSSWR